MRQILALSMLLVLVGCATTPTGEWKYLPVDGFFKSDITESELGLLLRQSELKCENELIKLKNQTTNKVSQSSGNSVTDSFQSGAAMVARVNAAEELRKFYPNCMELNGFKKTLIPYSVLLSE